MVEVLYVLHARYSYEVVLLVSTLTLERRCVRLGILVTLPRVAYASLCGNPSDKPSRRRRWLLGGSVGAPWLSRGVCRRGS